MNRGDHSEVIFREDTDQQLPLATLAGACDKADWQVHATGPPADVASLGFF